MPRLSKLGSRHSDVNIFVKRDDLTHGPAAGNKVRKLEFILHEAKSKGMKVVFTCGGLQSNHARATAVLCRELGLECVLFLRGDKPEPGTALEANLLIDRLVGARVELVTTEQYDNISKTFVAHAEFYRKRDGKMPLLVPEGGSNDVGGMGYVAAFEEITKQAGAGNGLPARFSSIVVADGSGGTHAGLLLGRNLYGWEDDCRIVGFNISRNAQALIDRVKWVMIGTIQRYRLPISFMADDIHVVDGYVGPGYAKATPELYDFIAEVAREDGIILDPVYAGKALHGLVSELGASPERAAFFGKNVLFIHTGGLPSLFAHAADYTRAITRSGK
ncbi:MAG: pyridoxal-phosphate dependent enzyme [Deltaproteobacteria bacterium]|nr:pyridoxal-phosphate dependent enzyme [Deltaproteobacteria bacterium]